MSRLPRARRRALAAFLLNVCLPPAGYVFAGAGRTALVACVGFVVAALALMAATLLAPPGIYALMDRPGGLIALGASWPVALALGGHATWLASRRLPRRPWPWRLALGAGLYAGVLATLLLVRTFAPVSIYSIASASMEPALRVGDVIAVSGSQASCHSGTPERGDLVVVRRPGTSLRWTKRVVGLPGERVETRGGLAIVNGRSLAVGAVSAVTIDGPGGPVSARRVREAGAGSRTWVAAVAQGGPPDAALRLGGDELFLLGDNRADSIDSRSEGPFKVGDVCGIGWKVLRASDPTRVGARP